MMNFQTKPELQKYRDCRKSLSVVSPVRLVVA